MDVESWTDPPEKRLFNSAGSTAAAVQRVELSLRPAKTAKTDELTQPPPKTFVQLPKTRLVERESDQTFVQLRGGGAGRVEQEFSGGVGSSLNILQFFFCFLFVFLSFLLDFFSVFVYILLA